MQETQVQSLGWEVLLEEEMATHSSILAWKIPWTEEPGGLQSMGQQKAGHNLYAEYIMRKVGLEEAQAEIKIVRRNISNLRYADDTTLWQEEKKN